MVVQNMTSEKLPEVQNAHLKLSDFRKKSDLTA